MQKPSLLVALFTATSGKSCCIQTSFTGPVPKPGATSQMGCLVSPPPPPPKKKKEEEERSGAPPDQTCNHFCPMARKPLKQARRTRPLVLIAEPVLPGQHLHGERGAALLCQNRCRVPHVRHIPRDQRGSKWGSGHSKNKKVMSILFVVLGRNLQLWLLDSQTRRPWPCNLR